MIRIDGLSKSFKRVTVLDDMSLEVGVGERVALIGANGAGKTTLIRCLLGEYHYEGNVALNGFSPRAHRTRVLREVGFVPQLPPPLKMPVDQLVQFSAAVCQSDPKEILKLSEALGLQLDDVLHRPFVKLSGGQKQKLLVAIAMGRDTRLLLLDEPAANLDTEARRVLFELLAKRAIDTTLVISSHRLDEVAPLVDRVIELDRGRVVLDDRVAESSGVDAVLRCRLRLRRCEDIVARTLRTWGFSCGEDDSVWNGEIAAPDRLRFLGMLARYSGLIDGLEMTDEQDTNQGDSEVQS